AVGVRAGRRIRAGRSIAARAAAGRRCAARTLRGARQELADHAGAAVGCEAAAAAAHDARVRDLAGGATELASGVRNARAPVATVRRRGTNLAGSAARVQAVAARNAQRIELTNATVAGSSAAVIARARDA